MRRLSAASAARARKPFEPVVRERVLERLESAAAYRVVVVVAPAGFGKSVAIRHFLERCGAESIRCDVRREHGTLLGFLGVLAEAFDRVAPNMRHAYTNFYENAEQSPAIVSGIAQWVASSLRTFEGTIVVDDLHHVRGDPRVVELLVELVERTKANVRWLFATRDTLELPIASWLAYGLADVPVTETDLRLTIDEAAAAARACDVSLAPEGLRELLALTDGWATAFAFALRASTRNSELATVARGTREMIYRFLAEQVFCRLAEPDREFLLRTASLPGLDLRVLRESDLADPRGTIERLRHTTAFVTEESPGVYRYHDLFRDFVEHELQKDDARHARACNEAAEWLEKSGNLSAALGLFGEARNAAAIVAILEKNGAQLFDRGEITLLENVLASLPRNDIEQSPLTLALDAMITALRCSYEQGDSLFQKALSIVCDAHEEAHILMRFAITLSRRWLSNEALSVLEKVKVDEIKDPGIRARFLALRGYVLSTLQRPAAAESAMSALETAKSVNDVVLEVTVLQYVALVAMYEGRLQAANEYGGRALRIADEHNLLGIAGRIAMLLAALSGERGDDEAHLMHVMRMRRDAEQIGDRTAIDWTTMMLYGIYTQRGQTDLIAQIEPSLETITAIEDRLERWPILVPSIAMQHGWAGNFSEAYQTISISANYASGMPDATWRNALRWAEIALYAAAAGEREAAERSLKEFSVLVNQGALNESNLHFIIRSKLIASIALILLNRAQSANVILASIERQLSSQSSAILALSHAVRALYISAETHAGQDELAKSLRVLRKSALGGFARLIEALPQNTIPSNPAFGSLTSAEVRVLSGIARGATSKELALELGRSALTVDSHVKAIVRKLRCHGRREVIALARAHGFV